MSAQDTQTTNDLMTSLRELRVPTRDERGAEIGPPRPVTIVVCTHQTEVGGHVG